MISNFVKFTKSSKSKSRQMIDDIKQAKKDRRLAIRMKQANKYQLREYLESKVF